MTDTDIELSEDAFAALFPLRTNYLNPGASWQNADGHGCLFETYGDEFAFITQQDACKVWTLLGDHNGGACVASGFHFVNRIGYLLSSKKVPAGVAIRVMLDTERHSDLVRANRRRAMKAELVIADYRDGNARQNLTDLLTDVRHWCDEHLEDFARLDGLAHLHYAAELNHKED